MALRAAAVYSRFRTLIHELVKFGIVGGIGSVIDLGGFAVLNGKYHVDPLEAKAISVTAATVFTYVGSRFWTFSERENQALGREAVLFAVLNVIGLLIAEAVIGFVSYAMNVHGQLEYNAASFVGTGLGTIFRFYAYRKWVFLAPASRSPATAPPALAPFPDYPPWELDPAATAPRAAYPALTPAGGRFPLEAATRPVRSWPATGPVPGERMPSPVLTAPPATCPAVREPGPGHGMRRAPGRHRRR